MKKIVQRFIDKVTHWAAMRDRTPRLDILRVMNAAPDVWFTGTMLVRRRESLNLGSVYIYLSNMQQEGLVERHVVKGDYPGTTVHSYRITEKGKSYVRAA